MLAGKGVIAWQRTVAGLGVPAPARPAETAAPVPPAGVAAELVSALAFLAMPAP